MLSGSREDSTSVTKYPYVSPLPEAPSRLECYWYVDVSSRTETIELPSRALCLQRTLLIHFPFLSPFFFPTAYVHVCPADYRKRGYAAVCPLYPAATVVKYRSTWVTLEYSLPSCLSHRFFPLFSSSSSSCLFSCSQLRTMPRASCIPGSRRDLLRLIPILETLPLRDCSIEPSHILHPLVPFWNPRVPPSLIYVLPDSFSSFYLYLLRISFRYCISRENELFPYVLWINRQKAEQPFQ